MSVSVWRCFRWLQLEGVLPPGGGRNQGGCCTCGAQDNPTIKVYPAPNVIVATAENTWI